MGGSSTQTQTSYQQKDPWKPTIPTLNSIIDQIGARVGDANLSPVETSALDYLSRNAQAGNPYASSIGSLASDLLSGGANYAPQINANYQAYQEALTPFARGDYVNPNSNPALQPYLDSIRNGVLGSVNGMFAAGGRIGSPANLQQIASKVTEAQAPIMLDAYNKSLADQMSAIDKLYGAGNTTTGLLSSLDQQALQNRQAGIGASDAALKAVNYGANQQLAIEAQRRGIPLSVLSQLAGLITPLANLGGTTNGTTTTESESSNPLDLVKTLMGAAGGGGGGGSLGSIAGGIGQGLGSLASGVGAGLGSAASGLGAGIGTVLSFLPFLSDERAKEDIAPIGRLYDGTPVYSYNYRGDPTPRVGLIAQDVERRRPDAVTTVRGLKAVDHRKATARARRIGGMLDRLATR